MGIQARHAGGARPRAPTPLSAGLDLDPQFAEIDGDAGLQPGIIAFRVAPKFKLLGRRDSGEGKPIVSDVRIDVLLVHIAVQIVSQDSLPRLGHSKKYYRAAAAGRGIITRRLVEVLVALVSFHGVIRSQALALRVGLESQVKANARAVPAKFLISSHMGRDEGLRVPGNHFSFGGASGGDGRAHDRDHRLGFVVPAEDDPPVHFMERGAALGDVEGHSHVADNPQSPGYVPSLAQ